MRLLASLLLLLTLTIAPAVAGAQTPASDVKLSAYERTTITWSGAAGQSWQVILVGAKGPNALPVTTNRKIVVDYTDFAAVTQWGQPLTAYVAPCAAPAESYDNVIGTITGAYAFCTPVSGVWAASSKETLQGPPDLQLNNARTRGATVAWRLSPGKGFAAPSGYAVRWRVDACPAASSNTAPCPGRNPWQRKQLAAGAKSFTIPGAASGTYWDVQITANSDAGKSSVLDLGIYVF
jgi:hypothetical protein